jgi:hypothetical protein
MFLGIRDPYPDQLVTSKDSDPAPDSAIIRAKIVRKTLISTFL